MRVLITGAQGWLGRYTAIAFAGISDATILGIGRSPRCDRFTHELPDTGAAHMPDGMTIGLPTYSYEACDLLDYFRLEAVMKTFKPTVVVHLAGAIPGAGTEALANNVHATRLLTRAAGLVGGVELLVLASSGSVYGEPQYLPQDEIHPTAPASAYARSKRESECAAGKEAVLTGLKVVIARIFNLVGPGCPVSLLPGSISFQLNQAMYGTHIHVNTGPLETTRDYVDVRDCAAALLLIAGHITGPYDVINIASGIGTPVADIWYRLNHLAIAHGRPSASRTETAVNDLGLRIQIGCVRRLSELGHVRRYDLEQSLSDMYEWSRTVAASACARGPNAGKANKGDGP